MQTQSDDRKLGLEATEEQEATYVPTPTIAAFHQDNTFCRALLGPVGSGKTTGLCLEVLKRATEQKAHNGVRKSRWLFIRNTYPELRSTTIKTWQTWVPNEICPIVYSVPYNGSMRTLLGDGTVMDLEVYFLAVNSLDDMGKVKSIEFTGIVVNEASEIPDGVLDFLRGRVGRYPSAKEGGASWFGIMMDTNPPKKNHWFVDLFERQRPPGHALYKQPPPFIVDEMSGGLVENPHAENIENLPGGFDYYYNQMNGASQDYIDVMVLAKYGAIYHGKPVHPNYDADHHRSPHVILPARRGTIYVGLDWGLTPAAVIGQLVAGQLIIMDELTPVDVSLEEFLDGHLVPLLRKKYPAFKVVAVGDPSGVNRSAIDKRTSYDLCASRGIRAFPAPTNDFKPRKEAVDYFLDRRQGLLLSRNCEMLHEGLSGGYRYKKNDDTRPEKKDNEYTHPMDGLQYICSYLLHGVIKKKKRPSAPSAHKVYV